jgi:glycosyltransferase involved in cell wall biosynthesis
MDVLWDDGVDANVVIVGRPGWDPDEMAALTAHPEHGKRLIWLSDASDEFLSALYGACTGLLLASEGEGFGLPLVEAAHHGLPLLTRDLPVTREVAGDGATYFSGETASDLAGAIRSWLSQIADGTAPSSDPVQQRTWREHSDDVVAQLLCETPSR